MRVRTALRVASPAAPPLSTRTKGAARGAQRAPKVGRHLCRLTVNSYVGVKGAYMGVPERMRSRFGTPIDRDVLVLPEKVVDDYGQNVQTLLRPIFDAVWNAAGYEYCLNYDENDKWRALR